MTFTAWGDESGSNPRLDPGVYLMAAAVCEPHQASQLRESMEGLRLPSSGSKLHWLVESPSRRLEIVETIAALPIDGLVVVRQGPTSDAQERRRRKCLEHLLFQLHELGCADLILESRGTADDRRDRQLHEHLRRAHRLPHGLRLSHEKGPADAALWVADAICGAVTQERTGDPQFLKVIERRLTVEIIEA